MQASRAPGGFTPSTCTHYLHLHLHLHALRRCVQDIIDAMGSCGKHGALLGCNVQFTPACGGTTQPHHRCSRCHDASWELSFRDWVQGGRWTFVNTAAVNTSQ